MNSLYIFEEKVEREAHREMFTRTLFHVAESRWNRWLMSPSALVSGYSTRSFRGWRMNFSNGATSSDSHIVLDMEGGRELWGFLGLPG